MGVFSFEQNRQYAVRTEVLALITLVEYGNLEQKHNALKQLMVIAYPEDHIKQAEQETLVLSGNMLEIDIDHYEDDDLSAVFHEGK